MSLSWNLTGDTDINDFEWMLITQADPDESITTQDSVFLSNMGPFPLTSKDAKWGLGVGRETRLLWFKFYSTTDLKTSRLGINEIIVNGYSSEECYEIGGKEGHTLVVSVSVMIVVAISMF